MRNFELYNKLVSLPLFVGMSREELIGIIGKTKFHFSKAEKGEIIIKDGDKSGQLMLLVSGELEKETMADNKEYRVYEYVKAPATLQPERTFGLTQRYSSNYKAIETCSLICIDKNETLRLTHESLIFRLNLLNTISTSLQKKSHEVWRSTPLSMEKRIYRFLITHCEHPAGKKIFKINMTKLAEETNTNRLNVSVALNNMQKHGLVKLSRGMITIPSIEQLHNIK